MGKKILVISIILCLLPISLLGEFKISVIAIPNVIYVPDNYAKIQWAIGNATEGDTIFVRNGTYYENIVINKRIALIGENRDWTIIDGSDTESVIFIKEADNVIVKGFTLRKSGTLLYNSSGVLIERSNGSIISNNLILTNYNGISIFYSSNTIIHANNVLENFYCGICLYWSSNTVIYHNNFNNTVQVLSGYSTNFWSYAGEGNYWSDYSGEDLNQDGIGDVPYLVDKTNVDHNPLMGMFHAFDVSYQTKSHQITIISNSTISDFQFQIGAETGNKIIHFKPINNESAAGFCRIMIPKSFMNYPYIVFHGDEEVNPNLLDASDTYIRLYFTYLHNNHSVTIISSKLYSELLDIYHDLNTTYYDLLTNYAFVFSNYTQLQNSFEQLNNTYYTLTNLYEELQRNFNNLTDVYYDLLGNYTQLQVDYQELIASYQEYLLSHSENISNVKNLTYVMAAATAILIIVTTYLSKRAHSGGGRRLKNLERIGE